MKQNLMDSSRPKQTNENKRFIAFISLEFISQVLQNLSMNFVDPLNNFASFDIFLTSHCIHLIYRIFFMALPFENELKFVWEAEN